MYCLAQFPLVKNGLSLPYHFDESICIFRGMGSNFLLLDENHVRKQNSPRWDTTFCGVTSGAILFAYVQYYIKRMPGLHGLILQIIYQMKPFSVLCKHIWCG